MRSFYRKDQINPELPGVVILSHGQLALGLYDAAQIVFGDLENVAAFCLEAGDDLDIFQQAFAEAYSSYPACLLITDMKGGTPCNQVLRYARENAVAINAVTGASLPMLLEVLGMRDGASGSELREAAIQAGRTGAVDLYEFLMKTEVKG